MIRVTTNGLLNSYRYNLMKSTISRNEAMTTVLTQRNFNSYAEDPAAAAQAFSCAVLFCALTARLRSASQ